MRSRLASLALVAGLIAGCAGPLEVDPATPAQAAPITPSGASSARPLVPENPKPQPEPVQIAQAEVPDLDRLKQQLQEYVARQQGTYGFYLIDLTSGEAIGVNEETVFRTASTFKLPMSMYVINQIAAGKASLDEKLTYQEADLEYGTGTLQNEIKPGDQYPLGELLELAITESDNIATNMICRRFGFGPIYAYMLELGGKVTQYEDYTGTTPKDMATYMQQLYRPVGVTVGTPELRQFLLGALQRTAFHDRTEAGVPEGVKVAHKIGTLIDYVHDVALVYAPERPFIIAVFSKDVTEDVAPGVITEITRQAYRFLNPAN